MTDAPDSCLRVGGSRATPLDEVGATAPVILRHEGKGHGFDVEKAKKSHNNTVS